MTKTASFPKEFNSSFVENICKSEGGSLFLFSSDFKLFGCSYLVFRWINMDPGFSMMASIPLAQNTWTDNKITGQKTKRVLEGHLPLFLNEKTFMLAQENLQGLFFISSQSCNQSYWVPFPEYRFFEVWERFYGVHNRGTLASRGLTQLVAGPPWVLWHWTHSHCVFKCRLDIVSE